ncbi:hypothetical protein [Lacticaseibacillus camelliae]|nr:hypothetical protein [Lacticaseibacillus camelliae]
MEDLLGCLLEPLLELILLPQFDAAHRRRALIQLIIAVLVDGTGTALGGWVTWQMIRARDWGLLIVGLILLALFGGLLIQTLRRYVKMQLSSKHH